VTITVTLDGQRLTGPGRVRGLARRLRSAVTTLASKAVTPHKASLRRLADMPLTVAAVPCADFAAFHLAHGWGWLATAVSLVVVEHLIADPE
jgi:hypothetical protein